MNSKERVERERERETERIGVNERTEMEKYFSISFILVLLFRM